MINRKIAADLYLNLLIPWETKIKSLEQKGNFDLRSKTFSDFKRRNTLILKVKKTSIESDKLINSYLSQELNTDQIIIVAKGDSSGARSIMRHTRNSIAHGNVKILKIKNKNFVIFKSLNKNKLLLYIQIKQSNLNSFFSAIKSTIK